MKTSDIRQIANSLRLSDEKTVRLLYKLIALLIGERHRFGGKEYDAPIEDFFLCALTLNKHDIKKTSNGLAAEFPDKFVDAYSRHLHAILGTP